MGKDSYFETRLIYDKKRNVLWNALCKYFFQKFIEQEYCILDIGCGYGDFINNIRSNNKIAIDIWSESAKYLDDNILFKNNNAVDLDFIDDASIDFVFISNLLEHISKDDCVIILEKLKRKLKKGGTINIIQPNFKYCVKEYFDDYTHLTIYTHIGLSDMIEAHGYKVTKIIPKFMPMTVKSHFPVFQFLIRLYLLSPIKPFGKQMFVRAQIK